MQEQQQAAVGIDIGTTTIRCAIGLVNPEYNKVSLVGIGEIKYIVRWIRIYF